MSRKTAIKKKAPVSRRNAAKGKLRLKHGDPAASSPEVTQGEPWRPLAPKEVGAVHCVFGRQAPLPDKVYIGDTNACRVVVSELSMGADPMPEVCADIFLKEDADEASFMHEYAHWYRAIVAGVPGDGSKEDTDKHEAFAAQTVRLARLRQSFVHPEQAAAADWR